MAANEEAHHDLVREQFSQQAESYGRLIRQAAPGQAFHRIAFIEPTASDVALDVACGTGSLTLALAPHVRAVTGLDLTEAMLEQAKAAAAEDGIGNVTWRIGKTDELPFEAAHFSLVTCSAAFHHLSDPTRALREMKRVCRPDGRIVVMDVTPPPECSEAFDTLEILRDPSHTHALPLPELREAGVDAGLTELRAHSYPAGPIPLEAVLATSFPTEVSLDEIRARYRDDADSGADRFGLGTHERDGQLMVTFPMSAIVWAPA